MKKIITIIAVLFSITAFAAEITPPIKIANMWARPSYDSKTTAVYMEIINTDSKDHELIGVNSDVAMITEIHKTVTEKGVSTMVPVDILVIPAESTVNLKPRGLHIMLAGLKKALNVDDSFELKLSFKDLGVQTILVPVRSN